MIRAFLLRVFHQAVEEFLTPKFDALKYELRTELHEQGIRSDTRLTAVENRIASLEQAVRGVGQELGSLSARVERLDQRVTDPKDTLDVERRLARLEAHAGLSNS